MASELLVNKITPESGSTLTLGESGDTIAIPSGATQSITGTLSGAGAIDLSSATITLNDIMKNTPAFFAYLSSNQTIINNTDVKIQFDTEVFDTDSAYDNSTNYRFTVPSDKAGKYLISVSCWIDDLDDGDFGLIRVYKNGTQATNPQIQDQSYGSGSNQNKYFNITSVMNLSVADYIEVYARHNQGADQSIRSGYTWFTMNRLIGA